MRSGGALTLLSALAFSFILGVPPGHALSLERRGECVVLLHGLFRTHRAMLPLQWYLDEQGYTTVNRSYSSLTGPIEGMAQAAVANSVKECDELDAQRIHFVTHSLGGILLRQFTSIRPISGLERVVMLGPPNQGSQLAEYISGIDSLSWLQPRAIEQLGTGFESVPLRLGPVSFELGVIAGVLRQESWLPGFPDEVSDGTVSVAETLVPGMIDFLQMPASHTFMIWNPDVMSQVAYFLANGAFNRSLVGETVHE